MEEEQLLKKRFLDLSKQADRKGIVTFSDFLNSNEQNIFHQIENTLFSNFQSLVSLKVPLLPSCDP